MAEPGDGNSANTARYQHGALVVESCPPDDRMAHAQCAGSVFGNARRLRLRSCLQFSPKKINARSRPLAREEERLAHIAELAGGRSEAEEKAQKEKRTARAVCMGAATSLRMAHGTNVAVPAPLELRSQLSCPWQLSG
jgi:hypothetical protein